jgi:hypothetical protein
MGIKVRLDAMETSGTLFILDMRITSQVIIVYNERYII